MIKFGTRYFIDHYLIRKETWDEEKHIYRKFWEKVPFKKKGNQVFKEGIYLGDRTLSNGVKDTDMNYMAKEHFNAQLFCFDPNRNPVYVLLDQPK